MTGIGQFHGGVHHVAAAPIRNDTFSGTPDPGAKLRERLPWRSGLELGPNRLCVTRYLLQAGDDKIVFRSKMPIERHLVGAGGFGDCVDADAADAVLVEEIAGCGDDAFVRPGSQFGTVTHWIGRSPDVSPSCR